jgi:hypothetical protein
MYRSVAMASHISASLTCDELAFPVGGIVQVQERRDFLESVRQHLKPDATATRVRQQLVIVLE